MFHTQNPLNFSGTKSGAAVLCVILALFGVFLNKISNSNVKWAEGDVPVTTGLAEYHQGRNSLQELPRLSWNANNELHVQ